MCVCFNKPSLSSDLKLWFTAIHLKCASVSITTEQPPTQTLVQNGWWNVKRGTYHTFIKFFSFAFFKSFFFSIKLLSFTAARTERNDCKSFWAQTWTVNWRCHRHIDSAPRWRWSSCKKNYPLRFRLWGLRSRTMRCYKIYPQNHTGIVRRNNLVHPKIKTLSLLTHCHVFQNLSFFLLLNLIVHFEINFWYVLADLKGIQDVGVLFPQYFQFCYF